MTFQSNDIQQSLNNKKKVSNDILIDGLDEIYFQKSVINSKIGKKFHCQKSRNRFKEAKKSNNTTKKKLGGAVNELILL